MRIFALVLVVAVSFGCQRMDPAERSASVVAAKLAPGAHVELPAIDQPTQPTGKTEAQPAEHHACGCAGGEGAACSGTCGGQCGGAEPDPTWGPLPEGTRWTALHVTGMHCGGCARKIERALAKLDGVKGVKIDLRAKRVEIAVAEGLDAKQLAAPTIDGLGYHVD